MDLAPLYETDRYDDAVAVLDRAYAGVATGLRDLLAAVAACDRADVWEPDGCRDTAQWLAGRLGITYRAATLWVRASYALEDLPLLAGALASGALSIDKVVELARFATPETEKKLIGWARRVTVPTVRTRADVACAAARDPAETEREHRTRYVRWRDDDEGTFLDAWVPRDFGAILKNGLDVLARRVPDDPEADDVPDEEIALEARRADALVALASEALAQGSGRADAPTVVVHAELDALTGALKGGEIEGAGAIPPEILRHAACDPRLQIVLHDRAGDAVGIGRTSRLVPRWLERQMRHRDRTCTFPGCYSTRFLKNHHIRQWYPDGETTLSNLVTVCWFHHNLIHRRRWDVALLPGGEVRWFRPDGSRYAPGIGPRAGPAL